MYTDCDVTDDDDLYVYLCTDHSFTHARDVSVTAVDVLDELLTHVSLQVKPRQLSVKIGLQIPRQVVVTASTNSSTLTVRNFKIWYLIKNVCRSILVRFSDLRNVMYPSISGTSSSIARAASSHSSFTLTATSLLVTGRPTCWQYVFE